ncbi:MAG: glycosyltransferase [Bacteroidetes bacterium]|nr:glycosyltransferase [Bacteroidota bacterium]
MKILHVNTIDFGGAATACKRIHLGLLEAGIDSKMLVFRKTKNIPESYGFFDQLPVASLWKRIYKKGSKMLTFGKIKTPNIQKHSDVEIFSLPTSNFDITAHPLYKEADIIQLNWVSGFIDEPSFFKNTTKPVIWRMADLYSCGGGNHYEKNFPFDIYDNYIKENKKIRKKALLNSNVNFVAISNWVLEKANESDIISHFPKQVIHNGVDFKVFRPHNKLLARDVFNLPHDKIIILLGADYVTNKRKGFGLALEALGYINDTNIQLVVFGKENKELSKSYISVGEISDERLLSILYSSADYFITAAIEEAFGQVTIESLASGTPVISFPTGGSLDIIKDGMNGVLAKDFSAQELANAIVKALATSFDKQAILEDVKKRFNIQNKIQEYINLYKTLIK